LRPQNRESMDKFVGFFKTTSWLLFLGALLWSYAYLPTQVTYRYDNLGDVLAVTSKSNFFFASLAIFLIANIVCIIFLRTLKKIDSSDDGVGLRNRALKKDISMWVDGFMGILNFFFSISVFLISNLNGAREFQGLFIGVLIYLGPLLILLWIFYLIQLITKKRV